MTLGAVDVITGCDDDRSAAGDNRPKAAGFAL
jgi:hypothetical protein